MGGFFLLNQLTPVVGKLIGQLETAGIESSGPYRPAIWAEPAVTCIAVPGKYETAPGISSTLTDPVTGLPIQLTTKGYTPPIVYVFDAILRAEHHRELRHTEHPVQTGAAISDHAFLLPSRVSLEIGMSDAMDSYAPDMWTGNISKSVSAFQTLVGLQKSRQLVTLTTRLDTYSNMLVESVQAADNGQTRYGLRALVTFVQIFLAQLQTAGAPAASITPTASSVGEVSGTLSGTFGTVSARDQTSGTSPAGTVQSLPVPSSLSQQHSVTASPLSLSTLPAVPGSGSWSSNSLSSLAHG